MSADNDTSTLAGLPGSPGLAIGTAYVLGHQLVRIPRRSVPVSERAFEIDRFTSARRRARDDLRRLVSALSDRSSGSASAVLEAYALMVDDPMLTGEVERRITEEARCAEWAVALAVQAFSHKLGEADDPYLRERSRDIEFVGEHLLRAFGQTGELKKLPAGPVVLVARDLSPAETAGFVNDSGGGRGEGRDGAKSFVVAFATEGGTRTSHTSITARALKLPAVVGVSELCSIVSTGDLCIIDGIRGTIIVNPTDEALAEARARAERYRALSVELTRARERAATTLDGTTVAVRANVEVPDEAREASGEGAEGVGLYRTEYLYVDRLHPPNEEEQFAAFRSVAEAMPHHPVVLRTFDIGGDKFVSTFKVPVELNPMLGLRAVRLAVSRPDIFLEHLRAMVRASAHGDVRIMVPMVSGIGELRWVRSMLDKAIEQVRQAGHPVAEHIPLGVMIEVPSAAILADHFARECSFLSIGTNDLIQYTLAVDRASRRLAYLASPFDPAIARLIRRIVAAGEDHGRSVSVCGAMAGDPLGAVLLLGLGVREFSMEVGAIAEIRETLRRVSLDEAVRVAERALELATAEEVESLVVESFAPRLHDLLSGEA
ncbi:MAG: phosphoenolpyruvate--protein phosphotransferase [Polyangiaceae bacterium]